VRKPQVVPDEDHEVVYERVAAVDVAKASGVVCMRTPDPDPARPGRFVNRIWDEVPAMRAQIAELGRELLRCQVQMVTLESTSDYWRIWVRREAHCRMARSAGRNWRRCSWI
jgi:transposase